MATETRTVYFERPGHENTGCVLEIVRERAAALGIRQVVVASYTGETGAAAAEALPDCEVVVAAGVVGYQEPNRHGFLDDNRRRIEAAGGCVFHSGHSFGMLGRAVNKRFGTIQVDEVVAHVLRLFSQGVKVCCEVACMAADAGRLRVGEEAVAIGGSARGADTAVVLRPANTHAFFDTRVLEVLCKPRG